MKDINELKQDNFQGYMVDSRLMFIGVSHFHFDLFMGMPHGADILIVYQFMMKTSQLQKTNRIWCTNPFIQNGIKIGEKRIIRAKKALQKLGLIIPSQITKSGTGKFGKTLIQLRYVETQELRENIRKHFLNIVKNELAEPQLFGSINPDTPNQGTGQNPGHANLPVPGKLQPNAYRNTKVLNINALRKIKNFKSKYHSLNGDDSALFHTELKYYLNIFGIQRNPLPKYGIGDKRNPRNKFFIYVAQKLLQINQDYNPKLKFHGSGTWFDDIRLLVQSDMKCKRVKVPKEIKERIKAVLEYHEQVIGQKYAHRLLSGKAFREKFSRVEEAIDRANSYDSNGNDRSNTNRPKAQTGTLQDGGTFVWDDKEGKMVKEEI